LIRDHPSWTAAAARREKNAAQSHARKRCAEREPTHESFPPGRVSESLCWKTPSVEGEHFFGNLAGLLISRTP
jgi:hypothetical protein